MSLTKWCQNFSRFYCCLFVPIRTRILLTSDLFCIRMSIVFWNWVGLENISNTNMTKRNRFVDAKTCVNRSWKMAMNWKNLWFCGTGTWFCCVICQSSSFSTISKSHAHPQRPRSIKARVEQPWSTDKWDCVSLPASTFAARGIGGGKRWCTRFYNRDSALGSAGWIPLQKWPRW